MGYRPANQDSQADGNGNCQMDPLQGDGTPTIQMPTSPADAAAGTLANASTTRATTKTAYTPMEHGNRPLFDMSSHRSHADECGHVTTREGEQLRVEILSAWICLLVI